MTEYVTPNIHTVLKKYQNTAPKSLQGPGHALVAAAAAAAAAGCPGGINCPLDASINSGDLASSSIANRALSPCIAANLSTTSSNSLCGNKQSNPAVALIKKEILTSPEPLPLSSQSTCSSSSSSSSSTTGSGSSSMANAYVDMSQAQQHVAVSPPTIKIVPPPPPELSQPILSAADSCSGELYETRLEGKTIGCFSLGGEMRLCLPQFLNNVLGDFTLDQINRIFDELGIFCSQCTPDQLLEFKAAKILPSDVKASGLITRTDAERLCAALLHRSDRTNYISVDIPKNAISFKVYHRCFGKCEGICTPDMYSYANPTCIMCLECKGWFSPQKFVGHVHRKVENRTCHWGFDSRNWHDYLHVALDVENREKYQKILDQLKEVEIKETVRQQQQREINFMKRKVDIPLDDVLVGTSIPGSMLPGVVMQAPPHQLLPPGGKQRIAGAEILDIPSTTNKKGKNLDEASAYQLEYQRYQTLMYAHCAQQQQQQQQHQQQQHQRMGSISAFRPWAPPKSFLQAAAAASYNAACVVGAFSTLPYLSQEPPVLQNPERVVRNADRERFERTYQPNVALAPRKNILNKEREKEQRERERERIDRERERELDRVRERERERERERQRERERDRQQKQQQQQQQQQIFQQRMTETICAGGCTNLCEAEVHIKQERASTPQSPLHLTNAGNDATTDDDTAMDRRSASMLHEEATMPMISPMALSMNHQQQQQQQQQLKSSDMTSSASHRRHSIHTSNTTPSSSGCSASSSITPPEQQLLPAHLPRHLKHLTIAQQQQQQQKQQNILRQSPSPSPTTNNSKNNNNNRNNLEEFGSSNEITSSTSPVPQASNHQVRHHHLHQQHQASTSASTTSQQQVAIQQQQQQPQPAHVQSIIATVNQHTKLLPSSSANVPTPITNSNSNTNSSSNNNEISSRIRINKNLMRSPTTPPPQQQHHQHQQHHVHENQLQQKQYEYLKEKENHQQRLYTQHQHQQQNQQQRQQQQHYIRHQHQHHSPTQSSSSSGGLNLSTNNTAKSHQQQQQHHQLHNGLHMGSEFELSTDTDDDSSLNGEPDSSNILAPWEMAVEALRDTRPKDRERVLQLLQRLLQENQQYRYNNVQLSEILQKRDAHISELREQIENYRRQLEQLEKKQQQQQQRSKEQEQQNVNASVVGGDGGGVIATKSDASEELRVPLKKSLRRDPDRTEKSEEERIVERQSVEDSVVENDGNSNEISSENGASSMVSKNTKDEESDADGGGDLANEEFQIKVEKAPALEKPLHQTNGNGNDDETPRLPNGHHDESSRFSGSDIGSEQDDDTKDEKVVVKNEVENENRRSENDDIVAHDSDDDDEMMNYNEEDNDDDVVDDDDDDDDDDDEELQRNCNEKAVMVQAPHTNAAVTPPTATTPISPDSAATAGQLFDSSNSSDDSSMKKAQMSASNALAKMTAEVESAQEERDHRNDNATERDDDNDDDGDEDEDTRSEDSMNESDDLNAKRRRVMKRDHDCIGNADSDDNDARDELLFAKKRHQEQEQKEEGIPNIDSTTTTTTKLLATTVMPTSPTTASTVVVPPPPPPSMIFKPIVTKASRKQTPASPTTNCDLQIKKEIF